MRTVKFADEEVQNLQAFLNRVDLKGHEAPAYMAILQRIAAARPEREEPQAPKQ